jgi:hypothetical protein
MTMGSHSRSRTPIMISDTGRPQPNAGGQRRAKRVRCMLLLAGIPRRDVANQPCR